MGKQRKEVLGISELDREGIIDQYEDLILEGTQYTGGLRRDQPPKIEYEVKITQDLHDMKGKVFTEMISNPGKLLTLRETAELLADNVGEVSKIKINSVFN